ncbi:hypothetical protein QWY85_01865, partial [Neolewinella lacunae]|nr:hypothetical protein [Neolewinella lacunae]
KDLTSAGPYTQGSTVSYNITVTNQGSLDAATVVVEDRPQAGLTYAGLNSGDVTDNGDGTFTLNSVLAQGASLTFNVSYTIDATFQGTSLTNVAEITEDDGDDEDSTPDNDVPTEDDQDDETITVNQTFDLAIAKSLAPLQAPFTLSGANVNYRITVTNQGSINATNVEVMDDSPIGLNYLSANVTGTNVIANGGGSFTIPSLAQNESVSFTITYMTDANVGIGVVLTNQIEITDDADGTGNDVTDIDSSPESSYDNDDLGDNVADDDEDSVSITNIGINVEKVASESEICPGEPVTYTLTVRFRDNICAPGLELREISIEDMGSDGSMRMLMPNDANFIASSDPNGDGVLQCGEEFMWSYTLTHTETYTNTAVDMAEVWFIDPVQGDLFVGDAMFMDEVTVTVNPTPTTTIADTDPNGSISCNGFSDGSATVTPTSGSAPFTYAWSGGDLATRDEATVTGLSAGIKYYVTVTDNNGCAALDSIILVEPTPLMASVNNDVLLCFGDETGSLTVTPEGGTAPYTYLWGANAGAVTSQTAMNLPAGTYSVTVTDARGCTAVATGTVTQPEAGLMITEVITDVECNGDATGAINITVGGGTPDYTYLWSNGAT